VGNVTHNNLYDDDLIHVDYDAQSNVDWVINGAVTPVKNQGQCGSCWSFSTTGAIEGIHAINTGKLVSLSEQQLVDCSTSYGNQGCDGGMPIWAYEYVIQNGGICAEDAYAYTASDGTCHTCTPVAQISGYVNVTSNSANALRVALDQQPVSVVIEADQSIFQFYSTGVITTGCGNKLDHAVLAVGYGTTQSGQSYFKIKNSWGPTWGDQGYVYFGADATSNAENGGSGTCGVLSMPTYPTM
jgi:cathepsin L